MSVGQLETQPTPKLVYENPLTGVNANPQQMQRWVVNKQWEKLLIPHFFGLLWNYQFIIYFAYMTIAGAGANWYFSQTDQETGKKVRGNEPSELATWPILSATIRAIKYHLGSLALGALIIAIIKFVRYVLAYIQKKAFSDNPNPLQKILWCMVQCVLKCLECCVDKINKNAYIWMAIWGDNFCSSSCKAWTLLWRNLGSVAAINTVGLYLVWLGKFSVTFLTTGIYALVLMNLVGTEISSVLYPCICIMILTSFVSRLCMLVVETVIDTTFLCYLVDLEHNGAGQMLADADFNALAEENKAQSFELYERRKKVYIEATGNDPTLED